MTSSIKSFVPLTPVRRSNAIDKLKDSLINNSDRILTEKQQLRIIDLLGGPAAILKVFLDHSHIQPSETVVVYDGKEKEIENKTQNEIENNTVFLNDSEINSLSNMFTDCLSTDLELPIANGKMHEMTIKTLKVQKKLVTVSMVVNNDFWHLLLKRFDSKIADNMTKFVFSRLFFVFGITNFLVLGVAFVLDSNPVYMLFYLSSLITVLIGLLALNVSVVRYIISRFLVWFKIYHILNFVVFRTLHNIATEENIDSFYISRRVASSLLVLTMSLFYCFSDGLAVIFYL